MEILQIEKSDRYKFRVMFTMEGQELSMPLYYSELRRFHISEGAVLEDALFDRICTEVLYKRAVERSQYLLGRKNYTVAELARKLREGYYPESVITHTVDKLKEYHFLDDCDYATSYIAYKSQTKSRRRICQELRAKGVSQDVVEQVLEESALSDEQALLKLATKRCKSADLSDQSVYCRQMRYLLAHGFVYEDVSRVLSDIRRCQANNYS
ncbi:MAG: recombination regulator RecX [Lachnospiraceae bacterium]|nr:recombination regulator RecX [Lachnospiraceae bacterium]